MSLGPCSQRYKLISSVYHNRSDSLERAVNNAGLQQKTIDHLVESIIPAPDKKDDILNIISNQNPAVGLGKYNLKSGELFFEALNSGLNIVIMDNYMDIVAKLLHIKGTDSSLFMNYKYILNSGEIFDFSTDAPDPAMLSSSAFSNILHIRKSAPSATIVFLNFPTNLYADPSKEAFRSSYWSNLTRLAKSFDLPRVYLLDCSPVHPVYATLQKQHFKTPYYAYYAGQITMLFGCMRFFRHKLLIDCPQS